MHHKTIKDKNGKPVRVKPQFHRPAGMYGADDYIQHYKRAGLMDEYRAES